jgi:superfamily II DNA/RNA helicase
VNCHACIGGKSLGNDLKALERGGVQVVSGTPGRVYDLVKRNALQMSHLKAMVLDEADEMLSRGFKEQIYDIYRCVNDDAGRTCTHIRNRFFLDCCLLCELSVFSPAKIIFF